MAGRLSLITQVGSLSIPGDLFNDIERTTCATGEHSTVLKLSLSYEVSHRLPQAAIIFGISLYLIRSVLAFCLSNFPLNFAFKLHVFDSSVSIAGSPS